MATWTCFSGGVFLVQLHSNRSELRSQIHTVEQLVTRVHETFHGSFCGSCLPCHVLQFNQWFYDFLMFPPDFCFGKVDEAQSIGHGTEFCLRTKSCTVYVFVFSSCWKGLSVPQLNWDGSWTKSRRFMDGKQTETPLDDENYTSSPIRLKRRGVDPSENPLISHLWRLILSDIVSTPPLRGCHEVTTI